MNDEIAQMIKSKGQKEKELIQKMKKQLDGMKFNATLDKITDFLDTFDEFCQVKHISKVQITAKRSKKRHLVETSTEK